MLDTSETRKHPTRQCTLYDDNIVNSKHSSSHAVQAESNMQIRYEEAAKAAMKAKQEKAATADAHGKDHAPEAKPLRWRQRGKLEKLNGKLEKIQEEWNELEKHKDDAFLWDFLPKPLLTMAQNAMVEVGDGLAEVHVVLTDGWEGGSKAVLDRVEMLIRKGWQAMKG